MKCPAADQQKLRDAPKTIGEKGSSAWEPSVGCEWCPPPTRDRGDRVVKAAKVAVGERNYYDDDIRVAEHDRVTCREQATSAD